MANTRFRKTNKMEEKTVCRDCGEEADPRYTINLSILGEDNFHYCAACGVMAKEIEKMVAGLDLTKGIEQ